MAGRLVAEGGRRGEENEGCEMTLKNELAFLRKGFACLNETASLNKKSFKGWL